MYMQAFKQVAKEDKFLASFDDPAGADKKKSDDDDSDTSSLSDQDTNDDSFDKSSLRVSFEP
jgi:hypothetical protein